MSEEDPFDCFGGDDDDDDDDDGLNHASDANAVDTNSSVPPPSELRRDPNNGILAFHAGTEHALLYHVQQEILRIKNESSSSENAASLPLSDKAAAVLQSIDEFSLQRHWMMHVGHEKGTIVEDFLKECMEANTEISKPGGKALSVVEIGTYCGYSSILIAKTLKDLKCNFNICSVEVVEPNAQVARKMVELAGLADCIDVVLLDPDKESLEELLARHMKTSLSSDDIPSIDFLFLDHDKSLYLSDLQNLEHNNFIKKGCFVAADNVVFAQIDDYRHYISTLEKKGTVRTRLVMSWLEYCEPDHNGDVTKKNMMKDGIELSVYLKDP